jgi:hypothetical protein
VYAGEQACTGVSCDHVGAHRASSSESVGEGGLAYAGHARQDDGRDHTVRSCHEQLRKISQFGLPASEQRVIGGRANSDWRESAGCRGGHDVPELVHRQEEVGHTGFFSVLDIAHQAS